MNAIFKVFMCFCLLIESLSSKTNGQIDEETFGSTKEFTCLEDGVFCSNNTEHLCIYGKLKETNNCSDENGCINGVGCISLRDTLNLPHAFSNVLEDHLPQPCDYGTTRCYYNAVVFCQEKYWAIAFDCEEIGFLCDNAVCVPPTAPTTTVATTATPPLTTTSGSCELSERGCNGTFITVCTTETWESVFDCVILGQVCNNGSCVEDTCVTGTRFCNGSSVIYCNNNSWIEEMDCSLYGLICSDGKCVESTCTSGNKTCDGEVVVYCNNNHWIQVANCSSNGMTCSDDTCVQPSCTAGSKRCNGSILEICNGSTWIVIADCPQQGMVCVDEKCSKLTLVENIYPN